ncbi:MAG: aminodeoxychorismate synthase component I [Methylococcaceae bacterium]
MPSPKILIHALPYHSDSSLWFSPLAREPWAVFLDSSYPYSQQGRYDIIATQPVCTLETFGSITRICTQGQCYDSEENPFALVKAQLQAFNAQQTSTDLPFVGGAIGYFSYDLARRLEKLPVMAQDSERIADMAVGIYLWALVIDHQEKRSYLVAQGIDTEHWQQLIARFSVLPKAQPSQVFAVTSAVQANMDLSGYQHAFERIKYYLTEGDCYQVNLTQRFVADCTGEPWTAYQALRQSNAAPFSSYLNFPDVQILSSSPERFLKLQGGIVETKPIKGTRPRKANPLEDQQQQQLLKTSTKDRAENVMIVDLLRNDLSKTCSAVKVPELFAIETYTTVHHLVSTVTGILNQGQDALDVLQSCFPGGSITGAPKIRAMQVIEELEPQRRGVYCGSVAYISFDGTMDSNIAIRTLVHAHGTIRFWAGGGIVYDSIMEEEYQECFDKAAAMLELLKQFSV